MAGPEPNVESNVLLFELATVAYKNFLFSSGIMFVASPTTYQKVHINSDD